LARGRPPDRVARLLCWVVAVGERCVIEPSSYPGVGQDIASSLVLAAGTSGDRLRSEASFSMLCGASPIPTSSGMVQRHRRNCGGDRHANAALHQIVVVRLRYDEATRAYF
jgi:transposase